MADKVVVPRETGTILANEALGGGVYHLRLAWPRIAALAQPGQFVHLLLSSGWEPFLRRPLSIYEAEAQTGQVGLLYQVKGVGTNLLAKLGAGASLDALGPLGRGFPAPAAGSGPWLLVAGGLGVAPLAFLARQAAAAGMVPLQLLWGLGTALPWVPPVGAALEAAGVDLRLVTEDGSLGGRGLVTDLLPARLPTAAGLVLAACGPDPMLRRVADLCREYRLTAYLSLEARMACGVGACQGCVVPLRGTGGPAYTTVCSSGPVFEAGEVSWLE